MYFFFIMYTFDKQVKIEKINMFNAIVAKNRVDVYLTPNLKYNCILSFNVLFVYIVLLELLF